MSKKDKLIKAMKNNPKNILFEDIKKLLEDYGYVCHNSGGSHFVFRKENTTTIVIPYHKPIKAIYVKHVLEILGETK
ncbi:MAG: type II toxin-antitoxin system HicA family toxin [Sulfuricurvum sp.]|uniref:type II toxin-antitoxin system HicA family toxin n=1 Tax=Sulfuricurvum sp. TaxID=2025608 RepID=UPI0026172EC9|nr:type II toxin-antitoxin system HicA family toxin [Sulfuricurvum sp.]MDD2828511.1 type II toxin-antitoxin system HicA family toxin [Sulfuricurvum sp.]MDD4948958.1 type II toxin-antitoxin system HicA family toxin [Sulfuricurvum sp.]